MSEGFPAEAEGLPAGFAEGSRLADYHLEDRIGAGGMAVVFRARDERLQRQVALKVLAPALAGDEAFRYRFIRESQAAAAVDDPHIIPVFEAGEAEGVLFLAMRYVPGGDVRALVRRAGPRSPAQALAIISPVASALDAAHGAGLVHRDVKLANILLDVRPGRPDHVYLSDFGLSKMLMSSLGPTRAGQFLGTPGYSAPEQLEGKPVDGRADQYSLACATFELLCGQTPFPRDQAAAVIWAHISEPPPPLSSRRPGLPPAVDGVLAKALAKAPADRYASCREFAEALREVLGLAPYNPRSGVSPHADVSSAKSDGFGAEQPNILAPATSLEIIDGRMALEAAKPDTGLESSIAWHDEKLEVLGRQAEAPARTAPPRDRQQATTGVDADPGGGHRRAAGRRTHPADRPEISRMAPKGWRARRGLSLLIVIPTAALAVLGGIGIASSLRSAQSYQRVESLANLGQQIIVLTQALEEERDQTAFYIALGANGGRAAGSSANPGVRSGAALELSVIARSKSATDQAVATVSDLAGQIGSSYSAQTQQAAATARAALAELPYLRTASISTELPALAMVQKYTQLIDDVLTLNDQIAQSASDPQLAQTVRVLGLVSAMKEEASQQRAILAAALLRGKFGPGQLAVLNAAQSAQQSNLAAFDISADVGQRLLWNNSVDGSFTYLANSEELQALTLQNNSSGSLRADPTSAVDWFGAMSNTIDFQMGSVERYLVSQGIVRSDVLHSNAIRAGIFAVVLLIALALFFAAVLGAEMIRGLRRGRHVSRFIAPLRPFGVRMGQTDRLADGIHDPGQKRGGTIPDLTGPGAPVDRGRQDAS